MNELIRIYKYIDIKEVTKHLIIAGELSASCANCRHIGIDFLKEQRCPQCQTPFKFIAFRPKENKSEEISQISRISAKRPDLTAVDYNDVARTSGRLKAQGIFSQLNGNKPSP